MPTNLPPSTTGKRWNYPLQRISAVACSVVCEVTVMGSPDITCSNVNVWSKLASTARSSLPKASPKLTRNKSLQEMMPYSSSALTMGR